MIRQINRYYKLWSLLFLQVSFDALMLSRYCQQYCFNAEADGQPTKLSTNQYHKIQPSRLKNVIVGFPFSLSVVQMLQTMYQRCYRLCTSCIDVIDYVPEMLQTMYQWCRCQMLQTMYQWCRCYRLCTSGIDVIDYVPVVQMLSGAVLEKELSGFQLFPVEGGVHS